MTTLLKALLFGLIGVAALFCLGERLFCTRRTCATERVAAIIRPGMTLMQLEAKGIPVTLSGAPPSRWDVVTDPGWLSS